MLGRAGLATAAGCSLVLGGCSVQLGSLFDKNKQQDAEITGSVNPVANAMAAMQPSATGLPDTDLAYARVAVADALARNEKNFSQSWENPETGARGSVTPLSSAYADNGNTCREFLASHVLGKVETWLEGSACQAGTGKWEVRSLKAWRRS